VRLWIGLSLATLAFGCAQASAAAFRADVRIASLSHTRIPRARLRVFAGAHAFLFRQRRSFAAVVDGFLSVHRYAAARNMAAIVQR
jgi:hypothetical protein